MSLKLLVLTASIIAYIGITLKNSDLNCNYIELAPSPEFTGNLAPNTKLQTATYLAKGKVIGPETIEISKDGIIYTGLSNGEVVSVDLNGNVKKITLIGNTTDKTLCHFENGLRFAEPQCGRPLGMRLRGNFLYIADGFYGLVKVDVTTGDKKIILSSDDYRFGDKPLKCANDLDIDDDGVIYFIDSSYKRTLNEFLQEYIEAQPRGRLFSFNEMTNELNLLHTDIFYPNGIQLTPAKDAVLINEDTMARILKYQLVGYDKGKVGVFADLPGFGDNIRLSPSGKTLIVPFTLARNSYKNSILDLFGRFPRVRNFIGSVIDPITAFKYSAKYGLIVEYDLNGNILRSWHDPSGKVIDSTSTAFLYGDKFYLGSFYKEYIGVVDY